MLSFITRRTLLAIPVLIGIMVVVFLLVRAIPGEPCSAILGEQATEEACARFDEANGLNDPVWVQLGIYMKNVMGTDFEYHNEPEKTAAVHLEPGVFTFGDIGFFDDEV